MRFNRFIRAAAVFFLSAILLHFAWNAVMRDVSQRNTEEAREPKKASWYRGDQVLDSEERRPTEHQIDWPFRNSSEVSFKQKVQTEMSERWIIVDAVGLPLSHIQHVTDVPGWKLLLYADGARHMASKSCANCVFVDDTLLQETEMDMFPVKGVTPFLFAIKHGAKWIYLTRKVYDLHKNIKGFMMTDKSKGMMYKDDRIFDVESHFGVSGNRTVRPVYRLAEWITPSVQGRWEPNAKLWKSSLYDMTKVERLPHAFVPIKQLRSFNTKGLLVGYESFWSLVGMLTFHEGNSDSWRLWRQWLFKDLNTVMGVLPPIDRGTQNLFNNDFKDIGWTQNNHVDTFKCDKHSTFNECALDLMKRLVTSRMFSETDLKLAKSWFDWLTKHEERTQPIRPMFVSRNAETFKPDTIHTVLFEPDSTQFVPNLTDPFKDICKNRPRYKVNKVTKLEDVVLVVMFNFPHYYINIATLNYIFRKEFTNIVFCGQSIGKFITFKKNYNHDVSFLEISELNNGIFNYLCGAYAMDMGYKVAGYLSIGDDVLLNVWNIVDIPRNKVWFQHLIRNASIDQKRVPSTIPTHGYWIPWSRGSLGRVALLKIWDDFKRFPGPYKTQISQFLRTLERNFGGPRGTFYEASDIFYVPQRLRLHFSLFSEMFYKRQLYPEISTPMILLGAEHLEDIVRLNGSYVWGDDRKSLVKYYNPKDVFLHAWKLSTIKKKSEEQKMYCERYLPYIDENK